ncbi:hypothetical protein [Chryseobacterium lactis]|uniref:hypothetical protein n=1 Tax=Chryseobacterium lactis TaxID=1241981 RepID=UPI0016263993|nr:hypothetical protein [Chryseobacterium lactis]
MNDSLKKYIKDHREEFDTLEPPEDAFEKIMFRLNEPAVSTEKTVPLFPWKKWMAAASITVIAGLGTYALWNQKENEKPVVAKVKMTTEDKKNGAIPNQKNEWETEKTVTGEHENTGKTFVNTSSDLHHKLSDPQNLIQNNHLENENSLTKTDAMALINNQYSASSRLEGIILIKDHLTSDAQLINIVSEKALSDENTNVRLAAVDALFANVENPAINRNIQQIFLHQDDPVVQKELISFLRAKNPDGLNREVNTRLEELAQDPRTAVFVKDEAYAVLMKY